MGFCGVSASHRLTLPRKRFHLAVDAVAALFEVVRATVSLFGATLRSLQLGAKFYVPNRCPGAWPPHLGTHTFFFPGKPNMLTETYMGRAVTTRGGPSL